MLISIITTLPFRLLFFSANLNNQGPTLSSLAFLYPEKPLPSVGILLLPLSSYSSLKVDIKVALLDFSHIVVLGKSKIFHKIPTSGQISCAVEFLELN